MTERFYLQLRVVASDTDGGPIDPELFEAHLDCVADALSDLADVIDPDLGANLSSGEVDLSMVVEAEDETQAFARCLAAIRSAIHSAEGCTPGWETMEFHQTEYNVIRREPMLV